jgi:hypothetical protein
MTLCHVLTPNGKTEVALSEKKGRTTVTLTGDLRFRIGFRTEGMGF